MLLNSASTDKNRHNELRNPRDSAKGLSMQQKLLLIGVDGVRLDIVRKENHAPNINRILNNGSSAEMTMEVPTISGPGWSSILTGTTHAQHGVQDNTFRGNRLYECPDFLTRAAVAHPMMKTVAASSWPPIGGSCRSWSGYCNTQRSDYLLSSPFGGTRW